MKSTYSSHHPQHEISFVKLHELLKKHFNVGSWWPSSSQDEVLIGAVLTQNTNWNNVEKSLFNLSKNNLLSIENLSKSKIEIIQESIKSSGFYHQKAKYLKNISTNILENYGSLELFLKLDTEKLRKILLSFNGIGPETADSILLYCGNKPSFVVDNYTKRITQRVFGLTKLPSYSFIQNAVHREITPNVKIYKELHGELVELAKNYCKKKPLCSACPLNNFCSYLALPT